MEKEQNLKSDNHKTKTVMRSLDFYSLSTFRDLLLNVKEHNFTLFDIHNSLKELNLQFCGFEIVDQNIRNKFKKRFPAQCDQFNLIKWAEFEEDNPDTFWNMYQFWCQKISVI